MNPARALLKKHVDRMIANGSPVIVGIPAWRGINAPIVLTSGQIVDSGITLDDYERKVYCAITSLDCGYSDAQGIVDAQLLQSHKG